MVGYWTDQLYFTCRMSELYTKMVKINLETREKLLPNYVK